MTNQPDQFDVQHDVEFKCKCGGHCIIGRLTDGEPVGLHSMPPCPEFERYDLIQFMRRNRDARDN